MRCVESGSLCVGVIGLLKDVCVLCVCLCCSLVCLVPICVTRLLLLREGVLCVMTQLDDESEQCWRLARQTLQP